MLEVLDDAINLRDERDAPLTLTQWLRCKRKRRGSPANRLPLNRARRAQAVTTFTSRSREPKGRVGEGTLHPVGAQGGLWALQGAVKQSWLLLLHRHEAGAVWSRGCKLPRGTAARWSLQSESVQLCPQRPVRDSHSLSRATW